MKLNSKNAIITGSSRGIGAEAARSLAAEGATVWVNYSKSADAAQKVVDEIKSNGGNAHLVQADMSSPEGVK